MKSRTYHVQKKEDMVIKNSKFVASGLFPGKQNGQMSMYNIRAEPKLTVDKVSMKWIPCACDACVKQSAKEWRPMIPTEEQERYLQNPNCDLWPMLEGLNDWSIVTLKPGRDPEEEEELKMNQMVLDKLSEYMLNDINNGGYGAFQVEDPDYDGFYLVQWTEKPYQLQAPLRLTEYKPAQILPTGELVAKGKYLTKVPRAVGLVNDMPLYLVSGPSSGLILWSNNMVVLIIKE